MTTTDAHGVPLPQSIDDVTAEWLTAALDARSPGTEVAAVTVAEVIHGSLTKVRLEVDYARDPHGLPTSLFLKAAMEDHGIPVSVRPEALFYEVARPQVEVLAPECLAAGHDEEHGVIVLENLLARGCTMADPRVPMRLGAVRDAVGQLASLHARWWGDGRVAGIPDFEGSNALGAVLMERGYFEACLDGPTGEHVPGPFRDRERMAHWIQELWALDSTPPQCFSHGDAHLGNTYVDADGRPGFLDWGGVKAGHWGRELCYFTVGALSVEDRRTHEEALLREYLDELARHGADPLPGWDEAWLTHRRHVVHGLLWFLCPTAMQPVEVIEANVARFAAAAVDHRVEALL